MQVERWQPNQESPGHSYGQPWAGLDGCTASGVAGFGEFLTASLLQQTSQLRVLQDGTVEWCFNSFRPWLSAGLT